ncbi:MAG: helix-turn-helix transcriptional regulator [Polyangiaceae bacterium]
MRGAKRKTIAGELLPPRRLEALALRVGEDELVVFRLPKPTPELPAGLTNAERAVVALVLEGLTNAEIARERGSSERTVANQMASIFRKTGAAHRAELVSRIVNGDDA